MDILLISLNRETEPFTAAPLGMAIVAGALKGAGHDVRVIDLLFCEDQEAAIRAALEGFDPGFIGLSLRNIESSTEFLLPAYKETLGIIRGLSPAQVVVGGPAFSIMPEETLAYLGADYGVVGEGEKAAVRLAGAFEEGSDPARIPGVCAVVEGEFKLRPPGPGDDLSQAQMPEWGLFPLARYDMVGVQSKRGCSFGCVYCTYPALEGRRMRLRDPEAVADELEAGLDSDKEAAFYFVDNVFNNPRQHASEVCRVITRRGMKTEWGCLASPLGLDGRLLETMARAGCRSVEIGADSLSEGGLRGLGKSFRPADVTAAVQACKDAGMMHMVFMLLGGPGEDEDTLKECFDALERLSPEKVFAVSGIRVYPGTKMAEIAARQGIIGRGQSLLQPVFYESPALGDRLYELSDDFFGRHPDWIYYQARGVKGGAARGPGTPHPGIGWDSDANDALASVLDLVPRLLRPMAKRAVVKKAAELAAMRGALVVGVTDVKDAFLAETPGPFRAKMLESLSKLGK